VRIARTPPDFLRQIDEALVSDPALKARRMNSVANMGWHARIEDVVRIVEDKLTEKAVRRQ